MKPLQLIAKPKETLFAAVRRAMYNATINVKTVLLTFETSTVIVYPYETLDVPIVKALKLSLLKEQLKRIS